MGVPSPFIGIAASPLLKSRGTTPLHKVDDIIVEDFLGADCFELGPPAVPLPSSVRAPSSLVDNKVATVTKNGAPPSPLWPVPPPLLSELKELNTFLSFGDAVVGLSPQVPVRRRALSDSGLEVMKQVMKPGEAALEAVAGSLEEEWRSDDYDRYGYEETAWVEVLLPVAQVQKWQEAGGAVPVDDLLAMLQAPTEFPDWPGPAPVCELPPPPPLPQGKEAYKPRWVYGSSWPYNCAPTTLILQNLPSDLTQSQFIAALDDEGFSGLYDFVFLPASLRTGKSSRYAIVNVLRHSYGLSLAAHFHERKDWGAGNGVPACQVKWSLPQQGLPELLDIYRNDLTMHRCVEDHLRPALYSNGWQVPMPPPTRRIRAPPMRFQERNENTGQVPPSTEGPSAFTNEATDDVFHGAGPTQWPDLASSARTKKCVPRGHA